MLTAGNMDKPENPLTMSWQDTHWMQILTPHNVMDYFSERANPFYDKTCNNEVLKMQRASMDQLQAMQGTEYCLLHVQEPILYVIRKQHRHSPTQVTPVADYYIIGGVIYQAPDVGSVMNCRVLGAVSHLQQAFDEARKYAKYHPSKGYWWDFEQQMPSVLRREEKAKMKKVKKKKKNKAKERERKAREEPSSIFQRRRVDYLLDLLTKQFPPKLNHPIQAANPVCQDQKPPPVDSKNETESIKSEKPETSGTASTSGIKRENTGVTINAPDAKRTKT